MKISIIGPPGSGKGSCAEKLSKRYGIKTISLGRILRRLAEKTDAGKRLREKYWKKGRLIPSRTAVELIKKRVSGKGYILDGFPRELEEAKMFSKVDGLDMVVFLKASKRVVLQRLAGRLQCRKCGRIYHEKNLPPKKRGVCDICRGKLYKRYDDKEEKIIRERFGVYHREIKPVLDYYKNILIEINADNDLDGMVKAIEAGISRRKRRRAV